MEPRENYLERQVTGSDSLVKMATCSKIQSGKIIKTGMHSKRYLRPNQDGGVGRYTLPPHTTKRRTTNLTTRNNHSCQKIELYGNLTAKALQKKHSSRPVVRAEMGIQGGEDSGKVAAGGPGWVRRRWQSHIYMQINQEEQLGRKTDHTTQGSRAGK